MAASWKKVLVESADISVGTITATLADESTGFGVNSVEVVTSDTNVLKTRTLQLGSNAFSNDTFLTGNQNIAITGDATGSGTTSITLTLGDDVVGNAQLDLVDSNSPSNGDILSYVTSGTNGEFQWVANTASANDALITLDPGAGIGAIGNFSTNQGSNETLVIGVDGVLEDLDTLGTVDAANKFIVSSGANTFAYQTAAQVQATLSLEVGSDVQAYDADLSAIAGLSAADGNIIVGSAGGWVAESGDTARTSLGLGTGDSPTFAGLTVQGTVTTLDSTNVTIKDQFILLADAETPANVDGGIVVVGAADTVAFGWDDGEGRWAIQNTGATSAMTALNPFGYMSVVTSAGGDSGSAPSGSAKIGNMYVNTTTNSEELYIYF